MIQDLGERIVLLRKERNLSQEALAERIGVSRQAISKWERGEASPDIQNLASLAEEFGLSLDEFVHAAEEFSTHKTKLIGLKLRKQAEKLIILAVAIFILSAFGFIALPFDGRTNVLIFGILITAGVLLCIKASFLFERFNLLNKDLLAQDDEESVETRASKKKKESIGAAVAILCVIIYLFISFVYNLWHPGWLVFLLIPLTFVLLDAFDFKDPKA